MSRWRDNRDMAAFLWPSEDGWPYPDEVSDEADPAAGVDEDMLCLHCRHESLLTALDPLEQLLITARFGLDGHAVRSMKELQGETGLCRADLRRAMGTGLAKLRRVLA